MTNFQLKHLSFTNILGIEFLEFNAGKLTVIEGKNGSGKTSIIKALQNVFEGGHDATLLRKGAKEGQVVLVLSDGKTIKKKITEKGSELKVSGESSPKSFLESMTDIVSVNPVQFLTADDSTQLQLLLEAIPIDLPVEKLAKIYGKTLPDGPPLFVIDTVRKNVYETRTGTNRLIKQKQSTITELESTLPTHVVDVSLTEKLDIQRKQLAAKKASCEDIRKNLKSNLEYDIAMLKNKYDQAVEQSHKDEKAHVEPLISSIAQMEAAEAAQATSKNTLAMIANHKIELDKYVKEAENLDKALDDIHAVKKSLLDNTPFENLSITEGRIFIDGVYFNHMNTAARIAFVVQLAELRAGAGGLVCLDGMECLDETTMFYFTQAISELKQQFFVTRVTESELNVTSK